MAGKKLYFTLNNCILCPMSYILLSASMGLSLLALLAGANPNTTPTAIEKPMAVSAALNDM